MLADISDLQGVAQIRLVRTIFQHRLLIRDTREGRWRHRALRASPIVKFLKHASQHRFNRGEDIFLRHKGHFEIKLIEFAGAAIRARSLITEAGRDLEVAIKPRNHTQLLELLRRLRQRIELARMQPRRHQEVARTFGAGCGQDRGLEFRKTLINHPPPDR